MNKPFIFLILFLVWGWQSFAQEKSSIKGAVVDTASNIKLKNASISILAAKDSMLVSFTRADTHGAFNISNLQKGKYILLFTYPKYADYVTRVEVDSTRELDLGSVNLFLKAHLLEDIVITGRQRITIKGDTTEYDAASFNIQPNAKVEDLLKQLPGIQVDQNGKITAQGQTVNKVLVDGEEFFGDDPTLVTRNIRGDMVDKVQLYDKQSEQAAFTGVDDGQKVKTINIQLKEDSKRGLFGKAEAGMGTKDFYQAQLMVNRFHGKEKMAAYGTFSNTGQTGLGWGDAEKYGSSSLSMEFSDDGGMMFMISGGRDELDSFDGRYDGVGIPRAQNGGLHYDNKWSNDKQSINANYKIGSMEVEGNRNSQNQQNLPAGIISSNSDETFNNRMSRNKVDVRYDLKIDSLTTIRVTLDGTIKNNDKESSYSSQSLGADNNLLNKNERKIDNHGDGRLFNVNMLLMKKFKKKGRSLSLNLRQSLDNNKASGYLDSRTEYFNQLTGNLDSTQHDDQYKINDVSNNSFNSNLTYTEPLLGKLSVVFNYGFSNANGQSNRQSFNKATDGSYSLLDTLYSNDYKLDQLSNQVGAIFNLKAGKTILNFGSKITDVHFKQFDRYSQKSFNRNFTNFNPQVNYQYRFSQQQSLRVGYNGNNTQPSIDQIQPIRVNTDPLNIVTGNPDLKPSFTHRFDWGYNSYKVMSNQYLNFYGRYSFTTNPIVRNTMTNAQGASIYRSVNLEDKNTSNFYGGVYVGKKLKKMDLDMSLNMNANGNTYFNMTNDQLNKTTSLSYSGGLSVSKSKQNKYDIHISGGPSYTTSESSLQPDVNNNGWGFNSTGAFSLYLPGKFQIGADLNYTFTEATQSFAENFDRTLLNAYIMKKFMKTDNLRLRISGNDLLNQNIGFNRSAYNNTISQNSYTTIRRYFMFSLQWEFNKMGAK